MKGHALFQRNCENDNVKLILSATPFSWRDDSESEIANKDTLSTFKKLTLQNDLGNFNQTWHRTWIQFCLNKGPRSFPEGNHSKIVKIHSRYLRSSSPEHWAFLTKLSTIYSW